MRRIALAIGLGLMVSTSMAVAKDDSVLTIGSDAPTLDVEHWVQNGSDRFKPVTKFEDGKVYVVEFWATWCGPCRASMPHLASLQEKYADKGVQIISISDEDRETVDEFLKTEFKEGEGDKKTYDDVTKAYCLTTDPDGSSNADYMEASAQNGIPTAFIVGKDHKIEWIGHPLEMDEPLEQVVSGKWDRKAYAEAFKEEQAAQEILTKFAKLMRKNDSEAALKLLNESIATCKNEKVKTQFTMIRFQVMMQTGAKGDEMNAAAKEAFAIAGDEPMMINQIAWMLYEATANGEFDNKDVLKLALENAEKAVDKAEKTFKASMMDTVAHLHLELGNKAKALEIQKAAIQIATPEEKAQLQTFLDELEGDK